MPKLGTLFKRRNRHFLGGLEGGGITTSKPPSTNTSADYDNLSQFSLQLRFSEFLRYGLIGIVNTILHAAIFFFLVFPCALSQATGNLVAFFVAVTTSFFLNARFTFQQQPTTKKYLRMVSVMALLSFVSGHLGDTLTLNPVITFVVWCAVSYVAGFLLTRLFVFQP